MLTAALCSLLVFQEPQPLPAAAQSAPAAVARNVDPPRLEIAPRGPVNLGSIGPQEARQQRYLFTNTSAAPIRLRLLDLSPGVTLSGPALQAPLPPKGSAELILQVDPTDWVGWQPRNVRLGTDDPRQGEYYLPIGMTVRPDLTVDDLKKSFGAVAPPESPQVTFRFQRETGAATRLKISSALPPYLLAEVDDIPGTAEGKPMAGGIRFLLRPSLMEAGLRAGLERITVATTAPLQPSFQLYLDWKLELPVRLEPARLVFLTAEETVKALTMAGRDGQTLRLEKAWIEGSGFRLEGPLPQRGAQVALRVKREAAAPAKAVLFLQLEGEETPLRIPLLYLPPPMDSNPPPVPPGGQAPPVPEGAVPSPGETRH
jgi:hypothetical protein